MGHESQDWEDPRWLPPQGVPSSGGNAADAVHSGQVGLTTSGCSNGGSQVGGSRDVRPPPTEYCRQVYRKSFDIGVMAGGGAAARRWGDTEVVVSIQDKIQETGREVCRESRGGRGWVRR